MSLDYRFAIAGAILLLSGPTANMPPEEMRSH
jgi:hypothetical protein